MAAAVNGVTLAALFYHHQRSPNNEEGFLFGKVVSKVEDTISDSQITNYELQTTIYITDFLPWSKDICLYGSNGKFNLDMVQTVLQGREKEVIGWYGCRRNTTMRMSMKEATVHESLMSTLSFEHPENFLFLISTCSVTVNLSTHSFDHVFFRLKNGKFDRVRVSIVNLGDTTHTQYKKQSQFCMNRETNTLHKSLQSFRNKFECSSGEMLEVKNIQQLSHSLHKQLVSMASLVTNSEIDLDSLETEVKELSLKLQKEEDIKKQKTEQLMKDNLRQSLTDGTPSSIVDNDLLRNSKLTDLSSIPKPVPMDIASNAYSIKLEELDNQVLDLDQPSTSKCSKLKYDDTWLDISINHNPISDTTSSETSTQAAVFKTTSNPQLPASSSSNKSTPGRTRANKAKTTSKEMPQKTNTDPFSFVDSMLGKEVINTDLTSLSVPIGRQIKTANNQREATNRSQRSASPANKVKESSRTGSLERQTRLHNKGQKTTSDAKLDYQTEVKIERARTQRAKTRNTQTNTRRSLSREDKNESVPKEQIKKGKLRTGTGIETKTSENKNKETVDSVSNISVKKGDSLILPSDEDGLPSSSPVF